MSLSTSLLAVALSLSGTYAQYNPNAEQPMYTAAEHRQFVPIMLAHGIVMTIAFALLYPLGAALIRLPRVSWKIHSAVQVLAILLSLAGVGTGAWMVWRRNLFVTGRDLAHPVIGIVVIAIMVLFMPFAGWFHHKIWMRRRRSSVWTYAHRWLGRAVVILGGINGGLGFAITMPKNDAHWLMIMYIVLAAVSFAAWWISAFVWAWRESERDDASQQDTAALTMKEIKSEEERHIPQLKDIYRVKSQDDHQRRTSPDSESSADCFPRTIAQTHHGLTCAAKSASNEYAAKGPVWISRTAFPAPSNTNERQEIVTSVLAAIEALVDQDVPPLKPSDPAAPSVGLARERDPTILQGATVEDVKLEWIGHRAGAEVKAPEPDISEEEKYERLAKDAESELVVLYAHGGALYAGNPVLVRALTTRLAGLTRGRIASISYRLAPQKPFPSAVIDLLIAYLSLQFPAPTSTHAPIPASKIVLAWRLGRRQYRLLPPTTPPPSLPLYNISFPTDALLSRPEARALPPSRHRLPLGLARPLPRPPLVAA
ncbi:hypothetical protein MRB53_041855 [Persea americana]|nr:hypothetical protein MRB53_041855 [Persea americana]